MSYYYYSSATPEQLWEMERWERTRAVRHLLWDLPWTMVMQLCDYLGCEDQTMPCYWAAYCICRFRKRRFIAAVNQIRAAVRDSKR